ncbi:MAG: polymer-forming cytoskeletal protein [Hyphomicrobiaceae bacterium]
MTIAPGTEFTGQVRGGERVEINGSADGSIVTKTLVIGQGGQFQGSIKVDSAEIHGKLRGEVTVRHLLTIGVTGDVEGDIQYGQLSLESGANLVADLRNVPPELFGDFELEVARGGQAVITPADLNAKDVDDDASALTFTATNLLHGHIAHTTAPSEPLAQFTQADVNAGVIVFVHSGAETNNAGFDVVVADSQGATAGPLRPVLVRVSSAAASA